MTKSLTSLFIRIQQVDYIGSSTYEYNGHSKLFRQKFGSITITNAFDTSGRRRALGWANASTSQATHSAYDNANRLVGLTNGNFNLRYDYEPNSHLVKTLTFRNTNATRMTTSKTYDKVNRLLKISTSASGLLLPESFAYNYNNASQRTRLTLADGSAWNYGYDSLGQVTSGKKNWSDGTAVPGQQFEYGYDDIGNRIFAREGGDNNGNGLRRSGYSVDSVNQYSSRTNAGGFDMIGIANALASVTVNNQSTYRKGEYFHKELSVNNAGGAQYQQITNIASIPSGGGSLVSSDGGQVYIPPATETFTHDLDGNLTQNGRWNLAWDAENRLINVAARDGSETATNVAFQYDNLWRRIYKKVSLGSGTHTTNRFAYDGWNLVAEFDGATNILKSYMWGKDLSGSLSGAGGVGGLTSMTIHSGAHSGTYFYAYDGNGNVTALINATNGAVSARYEYDPFHNLTRATGPLAKLNNFLAATKYYDWETGFYYYGYRYYEPNTGRWVSRDPIGERGGVNIQSFNLNGPINSFDFLGKDVYVVTITVLGVVPHQMIVADDGKGGHYWIDFGPQGGCCNRLKGPGKIGYTPGPYGSALETILSSNAKIAAQVITSSQVDAVMAGKAKNIQNSASPNYALFGNNCFNFAYSFLQTAENLQKFGTEYSPQNSSQNSPPSSVSSP